MAREVVLVPKTKYEELTNKDRKYSEASQVQDNKGNENDIRTDNSTPDTHEVNDTITKNNSTKEHDDAITKNGAIETVSDSIKKQPRRSARQKVKSQ